MGERGRETAPSTTQPRETRPATVPTRSAQPARPTGPQPGDLLQGTVYHTAKNGDLFLALKGIDPDEMMGQIAAADLAGKQYKEGDTVSCELVTIQEKAGEKIALCRPAGTVYQTGTVVKFDTERGYGFIKPDISDQDIFVHKKQLGDGLDRLTEGDRVKFRLARGPKGIEAHDVHKE